MTRDYRSTCAFCGYEHTCSSQFGKAKELAEQDEEAIMGPGDASVCFGCGQVNVVGDDGKLRRPTIVEQLELDADERIAVMRKALRDVRPLQ